jgi:hypothetical protein
METQQVSEWFVSNLNLVQLVIQEDFHAFIHCEKLKSYTSTILEIFNFQVKCISPKHSSVVSSSGYGYIWAIPNIFSSY